MSSGGWGEQLYFGGEHRHMILEAGAERKLMKLTYHGVERIIEPYSLAYKKAAGKPAREYFYAYDTTGGRSRGPSIKAFLNTDVEALSLTEDKFEARYEIELSKAGEEARSAHFGRDFGAEHAGRNSRSVGTRIRKMPRAKMFRGHEPTFKIQCPYCQKTFSRKLNRWT